MLYPDTAAFIALTPSSASEPSGSWDSIHVFEAAERGRQAHYKLTSTVMLQMVDRATSKSDSVFPGKERDDKNEVKREGEVTLSGSMTRQVRFIIVHLGESGSKDLPPGFVYRRSKTGRCRTKRRTSPIRGA